jgi:AraC-like DNA-binding protein
VTMSESTVLWTSTTETSAPEDPDSSPDVGLLGASGPVLPRTLVMRTMLGLRALGIDVERPLEKLGLTPSAILAMSDDELRWSFFFDFWEAVRTTSGQFGLGLRLAEMVRAEYYEMFGYVLSSSATLGDALLRAARFVRLVADHVELSFYVEGERAVLVFKSLTPDFVHPESTEFVVGAIGTIARQLTGLRIEPIEVRFTHPAPPDLTHHRRIFGSVPVHFSRPHNGYVFESSLLNLPIRTSDGQLCSHLERQAENLLAKLPKMGELSRKVQEAISEELRGGNPSAEHVADKLGMHPKTLSRRLKAEGTSHQQLLDRLRYQLAERYLREPNLSIGEIAFLLGYSDTSSFNKAFKRWTGTAPQHYRQRGSN